MHLREKKESFDRFHCFILFLPVADMVQSFKDILEICYLVISDYK